MAAEIETPSDIPETPLDILETPLDILETPLDILETPVKTRASVTFDEAAAPADVLAIAPKRKPGRPIGAKSKEPGKPRPRAKAVVTVPIREEPVPVESPPLPGSRPIPTEARDSREALMLRLLSQQANARQNNKVALWKSWFQ